MATHRRMAAPVADTAATEIVVAMPVATGTAIADTEIAVAAVAATRPATREKTPPVARLGVTRVGVEAGAVILADTHVVTEVEMGIFTGETTVPVLDPLTDTIVLEATTVGTAMTVAIAAVTTIAALG